LIQLETCSRKDRLQSFAEPDTARTSRTCPKKVERVPVQKVAPQSKIPPR